MSTEVKSRLEFVQNQIRQTCLRSGRSESSVKLIAVSKLKPVADLVAAVQAGVQDLGENYVQEWREKKESWPTSVPFPRWHLIGPLQTNKVKNVVGQVDWIHSVDREELAQEISKRACSLGIRQKILIQLNIGDEETKHGVSLSDAQGFLLRICELPGLEIAGLMALPPLSDDEQIARGYFRQVTSRRAQWIQSHPRLEPLLRELSLGTSGDFLWAIQEGATMVRVGTAIFGAREKT